MVTSLTTALRILCFLAVALACMPYATESFSQSIQSQAADSDYTFTNTAPAYSEGSGPVVLIDRRVSPFVRNGKFEPFAQVARTDGFNVAWLDEPASQTALDGADMLVVANAFSVGGANDYRNFGTLDAPSVYSQEEIALLRQWVMDGGALLILADHSPFAGGTIKLAEAFGFIYMTGSAVHRDATLDNPLSDISFQKDGEGKLVGRLASHPITDGGLGRAPIRRFFAFGGQAMIPPAEAVNLFTIPDGYESVLTNSFFREFNSAPRIDASFLSQGAVLETGRGRVAIFGETGGFTSQLVDGTIRFGFGAPEAPQNEEFVLSTLRWLSRYEPE